MPDYDPIEFEKDMKEVETRLKVLRAEYNQFLAGTLKFPPNFTEAQIRKIVKKYAGVKGLKGVQRFQYFNFVAKFNTMMEFFSRRLKDKQEGKGVYASASIEKQFRDGQGDPGGKPGSGKARTHVVADVRRQSTTIAALFDDWNMAAGYSSQPLAKINLEAFKDIIRSKTDQIRKAKGCDAVRYRIILEDGKVRIKAKPIKKSTEKE